MTAKALQGQEHDQLGKKRRASPNAGESWNSGRVGDPIALQHCPSLFVGEFQFPKRNLVASLKLPCWVLPRVHFLARLHLSSPGLWEGDSLPAMSFFAEMRGKSKAAQDKHWAVSEQHIQRWVENFQKECERRAAGGYTTATVRLESTAVPQGSPGHMNLQTFAAGVAESLRNLGGKVQLEGWMPNFDGTIESNAITVSWDLASCAPPDAKAKVTGHASTCPICMEVRPVVALVPCGHVVCGTCRTDKRLQQCPLCREPVSATTKGLFLQ